MVEFLDSTELFTSCFTTLKGALDDDSCTDSDLLARISPLPGHSGRVFLDYAIERCDDRAYRFLTDVNENGCPLVVPLWSQVSRWIPIRAKLAPWRKYCKSDDVQKIGWLGESSLVYTLVETDQSEDPIDATQLLRVWDLCGQGPIFDLPYLFDADSGPLGYIYTLDSDHTLKIWDVKTGRTSIQGKVDIPDCDVLFTSPQYFFTDVKYAISDVVKPGQTFTSRFYGLWSEKTASKKSMDFNIVNCVSTPHDPALRGPLVLRFSTDGSFAIYMLNWKGLLSVGLTNITHGNFEGGGRLVFENDGHYREVSSRMSPVIDLRISPDGTYVAIIWKGRIMIRSVPTQQARQDGPKKARPAWKGNFHQVYEVPEHLREWEDRIAGLAVSPDSDLIAIVTLLGRLILLQRKERDFQPILETWDLSELRLFNWEKPLSPPRLHMSNLNKGVCLAWSPNGKMLAVGHNCGFDVLSVDEIQRNFSLESMKEGKEKGRIAPRS